MKIALTLCLMLLCTNLYAQPDSLQNSDVKTIKNMLTGIHKSVKGRFTQKLDREEVFQYYTSYDKVYGDCDDFASAAYFELWKLGVNPIIYTYDFGTRKRYRHVIVCAVEYCFDLNYDGIFPERIFKKRLGGQFELVEGGYGQLNEDAMFALLEKEKYIIGAIKNEHI